MVPVPFIALSTGGVIRLNLANLFKWLVDWASCQPKVLDGAYSPGGVPSSGKLFAFVVMLETLLPGSDY